MTESEGRIRWGLVGLGNVVVNRFAPALGRSRRSVLTACTTRSEEAGRAFAERFGIGRPHASFDALIESPDVDVVYLATPNSLHYTQARQALAAGKHVLCEKPLALTVDEGDELVGLARRANRLLKVAYQFRFERLFERVREHLRAGRLGELRAVTLSGCSPAGQLAPWRQDPREGGILSDLGVHLLDLVQWMTGLAFADVVARANPPDMTSVPVRTISILGTLGRDCHAVLRASRECAFGRQALLVEGTLGTLKCEAWRGVSEIELALIDASGRSLEKLAPSSLFEREIEAFEDELEGKPTALATGEEGVQVICVTDAVRRSAGSGQTVVFR